LNSDSESATGIPATHVISAHLPASKFQLLYLPHCSSNGIVFRIPPEIFFPFYFSLSRGRPNCQRFKRLASDTPTCTRFEAIDFKLLHTTRRYCNARILFPCLLHDHDLCICTTRYAPAQMNLHRSPTNVSIPSAGIAYVPVGRLYKLSYY
jgi:hypothetical protein